MIWCFLDYNYSSKVADVKKREKEGEREKGGERRGEGRKLLIIETLRKIFNCHSLSDLSVNLEQGC